MKKKTKNSFKHRDPEKNLEKSPQKTTAEKKPVAPLAAITDLKRAAYAILVFLAMILAIYLGRDYLNISELGKLINI
jgi:hypothetical protein